MTTTTNSFGQRLKLLIKKAGFTQEQFADNLGVQRNTVWRWVNDKATPEHNLLQSIAILLHVSVADLFNDNSAAWVLSVKIDNGDFTEEMINLTTPIATIITRKDGAFLQLGGNWDLWTDEKQFKKILADMKRLRPAVLNNGEALGAIKTK